MYLFSRRARLGSLEAIEWAVTIAGKAREASGNSVELWATTLSPGFGTVSWTSWWADLASLEAGLAKIQVDAGYNELAAQGGGFIDGVVDDSLFQTLAGDVDPEAANQYVNGVQAACAGGNLARAMTSGIEIAQRAEAITGLPTLFVRSMTGPYGGVGWLTGYPDLAGFESAMDKMAADPGWLTLLDSTNGCFVEDANLTQSTLYTKLA